MRYGLRAGSLLGRPLSRPWRRVDDWTYPSAMRDLPDLGLLVMRVGLGASFVLHGWPKMLGGPAAWHGLGTNLRHLIGVELLPTVFGFLAAFAELGGGALLLLGVLFRPALVLLVPTMAVAAARHLALGEGFHGASHALEAGVVFVGLFLTGPGKHRVQLRGVRGFWS